MSKFTVVSAAVLTACLALPGCSSPQRKPATLPPEAINDPYLWLENVESPESLAFARAQNEKSLAYLTALPQFPRLEGEIRKIVTTKDRLPYPALRNGYAYNFWQDQKNVKGLWRRTPVAEFAKPDPKWEILLDLDALSKQENESWVWKGSTCLPPVHERCLIRLSRGGKDAAIVREFDVARRSFVTPEQGGFYLPEAKSDFDWVDANTLFVGTDFGPGSLTESGYARLVKLWKRGTPLDSAKLVFEGETRDVWVSGFTSMGPEGTYRFVNRAETFFEQENFLIDDAGKLVKLPFPLTSSFEGVHPFHQEAHLFAKLRKEWKVAGQTLPEGAVVSLPLASLTQADPLSAIQLVYAPDSRTSVQAVTSTRSEIHLTVLQNVRGKLLKLTRAGSQWKTAPVDFFDDGTISVVATDPFDPRFFVSYENFLTPTSFYLLDDKSPRSVRKPVKALPAQFNAQGLVSEQWEATSADGTKIPYFVVHRKGLKLDGSNPTLLYGYGGFESSQDPFYASTQGKAWLEKGGVYALANIRGGGEFGPRWHQAALKENRQRAYDDFIAVAENLIARKVTVPQKLGIWGGSNGGLLVGAVFVQRPELFNAVICEVPLLDMLRYHLLLAGSSWMAEYGDPEDPRMAEFLRKYSPYHNVRAGAKYPKVFFYTSTKDDRVHPAHARKMVARMLEQGHPLWYYENIEGGHSGGADLEQKIRTLSLKYSYLFDQLAPSSK